MEEQDKIGQYILIRRIGEGGMAEVWEGHHVHLETRTAIKFLLPEFARNKNLQERFLNEGKRQAQLRHPNIVPAIDFFQVDGRSFLVMQFVEGGDLENRLRLENPPLSLEEIHSICWDVLSALDYAHSMGVVHRDVKPANMLMDRTGRTLLMDFGIAKALREERSVTMTGTSMGTSDYMSPEQILRPKEVDARSDIYSFGCVLYAMLSGNPPFSSEGATVFSIQERQVNAAPPPLVYRNLALPRAMGDVVMKCLEKDPAKRYQTCAEVMAALDAAVAAKPVAKKPEEARGKTTIEIKREEEKPPSSIKKYVMAGALVVFLIAGLVYFLGGQKNTSALGSGATGSAAKDWTNVSYNDPDFPDCKGVQECLDQKAKADKLLAVDDWRQQPYNSPFFKDCMGLKACEDRKTQSLKLQQQDWDKVSDKQLLEDCMSLPSCISAKALQAGKAAPSAGGKLTTRIAQDSENLPECCSESSNPAACKSAKKKDGLEDCPMGHR